MGLPYIEDLSLHFFCDCPVLLEFRYCFTGNLSFFARVVPPKPAKRAALNSQAPPKGPKEAGWRRVPAKHLVGPHVQLCPV